jgi:hypothetical protein
MLRRAQVLQLQRWLGNRAVGRLLAGRQKASAVQRSPIMLGPMTAAHSLVVHATKQQVRAEEQARINAIVTEQIVQALEEFKTIPINVTYTETVTDAEGNVTEVQHSTTVPVHPPYFRNVKKDQRYKDAISHRKGSRAYSRAISAGFKTMKDQGLPAHGGFKNGKSHPSQIKAVLEAAVRQGSVNIKPSAQFPDSDDLRQWLIQYGIGVDCSGFVGFALNKVLSELEAEVGDLAGKGGETHPADGRFPSGHEFYKGGASKNFSTITTPDVLRIADVMGIGTGHVRIIMSVQQEDSAVVFETAESSSGGGELSTGGSVSRNVGPQRRRWRFPDGSRMVGLERWNEADRIWVAAGTDARAMAYGRAKFVAESTEGIVSAKTQALVDALFEQGDEAIADANQAGE